ncbi:MAG: helix-turn-helix transcriptional regulator [Paludibacteraceae bacterium]|nr:helix-turn-helix transcriptional regulator [Paludibacteraceae bacterium]
MKTNLLMEECRQRFVTPEVQKQVDFAVTIADRVYDILEQKGMSQKDFALRMGKTEAEVSRWLSGTHNLTIATLAKMSIALDKDLL